MTKTIAVLLSLCILLASCGRDQKILDLEKREKEKAAQSVKEHIDELEGKVTGYEQQLNNYQNQHTSTEIEQCDCDKNTECECTTTDTSQEKAGRWGKWDNPYFSIDTWMNPSKWDLREYLTIAGVTVLVLMTAGGIAFYVYKNKVYKREMDLKKAIEDEKDKFRREKELQKWADQSIIEVQQEREDTINQQRRGLVYDEELIKKQAKKIKKLEEESAEEYDKRAKAEANAVLLEDDLKETKKKLAEVRVADSYTKANLEKSNKQRDAYRQEAETANKDKEEAYIARNVAIEGFEKRDATLAATWKEKDAVVYALSQKEAELQLLKEKYEAK